MERRCLYLCAVSEGADDCSASSDSGMDWRGAAAAAARGVMIDNRFDSLDGGEERDFSREEDDFGGSGDMGPRMTRGGNVRSGKGTVMREKEIKRTRGGEAQKIVTLPYESSGRTDPGGVATMAEQDVEGDTISDETGVRDGPSEVGVDEYSEDDSLGGSTSILRLAVSRGVSSKDDPPPDEAETARSCRVRNAELEDSEGEDICGDDEGEVEVEPTWCSSATTSRDITPPDGRKSPTDTLKAEAVLRG
ncbi:hypothetical protein FISHEDRAFT_62074 [Fistulina hepatica ATCC 64428]|nr:hypothetical protein FISHEDRAFT_62074 [Fistulina hepatica ATCC 64428]